MNTPGRIGNHHLRARNLAPELSRTVPEISASPAAAWGRAGAAASINTMALMNIFRFKLTPSRHYLKAESIARWMLQIEENCF